MKRLDFDIKSNQQIEDWLEKAEEKMSEDDFNYIATMAFNLANMDEFIFGSDEVSDKFFKHQARNYYGGLLH
jgi:hypothetical protein|tara:strand:- start:462 stop:677 length:216 start_codon:yes stop_codon:yes gene_type:complete